VDTPVPVVAASPDITVPSWQRLQGHVDEIAAALDRYLDEAYAVERDDPDLAAVLLSVRQGKAEDHRELVRILSQLEQAVLDRPGDGGPQSGPPAPDSPPEVVPMVETLDIDGAR
jgi:hypothetical protein